MNKQSKLILPKPKNQQIIAGILDFKLDNSSFKSTLNFIEIPIIDKHSDKVASNSAIVEILLINNIQIKPDALVHSFTQSKNQYTIHLLDLSKFLRQIHSKLTSQSKNRCI